MGTLTGKVALITGSTRGLGRTMAEWLARDGAGIVISGRDDTAVAASVDAVSALGVPTWGIPADLAVAGEARRLAGKALELAPQIDILVNNAGMSIRSNFWDVNDADWETQVNVNFRSPFVLAQVIGKQMIDRQIAGRIINVSTIGARACHANAAVYDSAKGGVETMTRNMAYELGRYGITVNCVVPGAISDRPGATNTDPEGRKTYERHIPAGRVGRADDIAAVVSFFASPASQYTTGQSLLVDGAHSSYLPESGKGFAF